MGIGFFVKSVGLGVGLAMDAFSVSLANGLNEPCMKKRRMGLIAGMFAFFQFLMPMVGWICVHTVVQYFTAFESLIPWIALILLSFIGGKMLVEGIRDGDKGCDCENPRVSLWGLVVQGVATSIDALSVGFTIAGYGIGKAFLCCVLIAVVTFLICTVGLELGKRFGTRLAGKASVFGGVILIAIGIEIFLTGIL
ncbi:MAG: manganese efflux pump [Clostridia bacterium]|nr:manganese efflux pump [Clostridia bacterium]